MPQGGRREGSGRKPGVSAATKLKHSISDHFTEEEVVAFIAELKAAAKTDNRLKQFLAEQLFGKAPQRIEMSGKDGEPIVLTWQQ